MVDAAPSTPPLLRPRERLERLVEAKSFEPWHLQPTGHVGGFGLVQGRWVAVWADDPLEAAAPELVGRFAAAAAELGHPLFWLAHAATGDVPLLGALRPARGQVPIALVSDGLASPERLIEARLADFAVAIGEAPRAGRAHDPWDRVVSDEMAAFALLRELVGFWPGRRGERASLRPAVEPPLRSDEELARILPQRADLPYDVKAILVRILDEGRFFEVAGHHGHALVLALAHLGGRPVGVVAWQPKAAERSLTLEAADRAERFIESCDAFGVPLLILPDQNPAGPAWEALCRHGGRLLDRLSRVGVPRLGLVVREPDGSHSLLRQALGASGRVLVWRSPEAAASAEGGQATLEPRRTRRHLLRALELANRAFTFS